MNEDTESALICKEGCPDCGSSDALARYDDGHTYCFSCTKHTKGTDSVETSHSAPRNVGADLLHGEFGALPKRRLTEDTCRKFGYRIGEFNGNPVHLCDYRDDTGDVVAQHVRFPNKDFIWRGSSKNVQLFGQHLWGGGRMVVVTEGELDCMSVSQQQGNKWPTVSIPSGAVGAAKAIKRNLQFFDQYETVVLMFDMDEAGRAAVEDVAPLFPVGKVKVASLPLKDASDMLQAGRGPEIVNAIWQAKPWRPDGILKLSDLKDAMNAKLVTGLPWAFETLTKLTYGRRHGEIYAVGAGTGVGKTDFLTQQVDYDISILKEKVGIFFLEQQPIETGKRIAGKNAGKRFHIPDAGWTEEELSETVERLLQNDGLYLYDHFGTTDWDIIKNRMRYLAVSEGVRIFYLDHLTALAASQDDERKALEVIMSEMGGMVKELDIMIILVSHLATPDGKPHEEGGRVMIRHFKGSRAIGFWCHFMFGLERDQQAEDLNERQTTTFRVLKDRYTGQATGQTFLLGYDVETGRLHETTPFAAVDDSGASEF